MATKNKIVEFLLKSGLIYKDGEKYHKLKETSKIVDELKTILNTEYFEKSEVLEIISKIAFDMGYTTVFHETPKLPDSGDEDEVLDIDVENDYKTPSKTSGEAHIRTKDANKDDITKMNENFVLDPIKGTEKGGKDELIDNSPFVEDVKIKNIEHLSVIINSYTGIDGNVKSSLKKGKKISAISYVNKDLGRLLSINFIEGEKSVVLIFGATLSEDMERLNSSKILEPLGKITKSDRNKIMIRTKLPASFTDTELRKALNVFGLKR